MKINFNTSISFNAKYPKNARLTTFRVPGKNSTTVVTDMVETGFGENLIDINYRIMKKGKILEKNAFHDKKGFSDEDIIELCSKIQEKVNDDVDFFESFLIALIKGGN